jgi:hypothetical protein
MLFSEDEFSAVGFSAVLVQQLVTWGYITGDPILDAGHEGNFYPQVIRENEGAISQ